MGKKLSADEIEIFGRPNFACAKIAKLLIECGVYEKGPEKAEYEQAVYIHWASGLLKNHGSRWKEIAFEILKANHEALKAEVINGQERT